MFLVCPCGLVLASIYLGGTACCSHSLFHLGYFYPALVPQPGSLHCHDEDSGGAEAASADGEKCSLSHGLKERGQTLS